MTSPVAVHDGMLPVFQGGNGLVQHRVNQLCVWTGADRPRHRQPVKAIHDGREIHFPGRDGELRNVCQPYLIGLLSVKVPVDLVLNFRADCRRRAEWSANRRGIEAGSRGEVAGKPG